MPLKKTPLHDWHIAHGAVMGAFTGYDMPLWYTKGVRAEHLSVLTSCGVFDTSHMAVLRLTGPDIHEFLQWCYSRDLDRCLAGNTKPLRIGRCTYGVFLNEAGGVVDDVIVFQTGDEEYLAIVNAAMGHTDARHLLNHIYTCDNACKVLVSDFSDRVGKIDIQGPKSAPIMRAVIEDAERVLEDMVYFSFKGSFDESDPPAGRVTLKNGVPVMLSRTGYTGEFGFELYVAPEHTVEAMDMIMDAGREFDITPCGLAARDSLRGGAVMPLSHQDNGNWRFVNNPWTVALPYTPDCTGFTKDFLGRKALEGAPPSYYTYPFVGNDPRKVMGSESPALVFTGDGAAIGIVLSCVTDVGIGWAGGRIYSVSSPDKPEGFEPRGLSCGFIRVDRELQYGERVTLRDARRELPVTIVKDIRPDRTARKAMRDMLYQNV